MICYDAQDDGDISEGLAAAQKWRDRWRVGCGRSFDFVESGEGCASADWRICCFRRAALVVLPNWTKRLRRRIAMCRLCDSCLEEMEIFSEPMCERCGAPVPGIVADAG